MGGERETFLESESKAPEVHGSVSGKEGSRVRIHQNNGEVHLHDDTNKIKCAIPVAEWWKAWEKLRTQPGTWTWIDSNNNSCVIIETVVDFNAGPVTNVPAVRVDEIITLLPADISPNYRELNNFTKKR